MNRAILMGRLTRDPDIRYGQGEDTSMIARFTLAVDRRIKQSEGQRAADFISCIAFGERAVFVEKYLKQGSKIVLEGRIQTGSYTNREGQKVYTTDIVADSMEFAESKASQGSGATSSVHVSAPSDGFMSIPDGIDDELPFA